MKVIILGSGASGMIAAHAAVQCGASDLLIFDKKPEIHKYTGGLMYLHKSCDLLLKPITITQTIIGAHQKREDIIKHYSEKVYGKVVSDVSITNVIYNEKIVGYSTKQALDRLWDLYGHCVKRSEEFRSIDDIMHLCTNNTKVISTIPIRNLFPDLKCDYITAWAKIGEAPKEESFVLYSVSPVHQWYRTSAVDGVFVQEFASQIPEEEGYLIKPLIKVTNKVKIPFVAPNILFTGRYGAWDKTCLLHDVYDKVIKWLS